ncbi:hypothetical protein BsWGS_25277 [Bradybaena similaris]
MAYPSPTRNVAKGSYELYEPQQKAQESPELKKLNTAVETAPGSPSSYQDYGKVIDRLQKELEDSRKKELVLQQMLSDLKSPLTSSVTNLFDSAYFDAAASNESVGESVKEGHIKHLQRKVTVLQANLYKSEERVATAVRERDKALDDVARLTSEMREMQETNFQQQRKLESLNTALQEARRNLQLTSEQLQSHHYSAQLVSQLKEEIVKQKTEIKTLQESVDRLDLENKSIKDPSIESGGQSLGNIACSLELEHLHKVVDKLKSTVLQQRSYLLQLRQPVNAKSMSMPSPVVNTDGVLDHDPLTGRKSSSPKLRGTGSLSGESAFRTHPQPSVLGHSSQSIGLKSGSPRENVFDIQPRNGSGEFLPESLAKRNSNSREMLNDTFRMDVLNLPSTFPAQAGGLLEPSRHATNMNHRNGYLYASKRQSSPGLSESETTDAAQKNVGNVGLTASDGYETAKSVQRKMFQHTPAQSEVLGNRNAQEGLDQNKTNSKSDVLGWPTRQWNLSSANNSAVLGGKDSSEYMDTFSQPEPGMVLNQAQRFQPPKSAMQVQQETQGRINDTNNLPADTQGQYVLNGSAVQMMLDNNLATDFENTNVNSAKTHFHQMYKLSSAYQEQPCQDLLQDVIGGDKKAVPPPMTHSPAFHTTGGRQEVVYVNSRGDQGMFSSSSSVDPDPSVSRVNSDKLCPVCNNDYSQVSMEDFQTHVFECFDDENPPETMKAHTSPERLCPMCSASFSYDMPQVDFERHVHGHFGEENPAEPFEILHP